MTKPATLFQSTNQRAEGVDFRQALLQGMAPDGGLFMPKALPEVSADEISSFSGMEYYQVAYSIIRKILHDQVPDDDLAAMVKEAYSFPAPLERIVERKYVLRLDRGPTASFKDFAARLMGRLMHYYLRREKRDILILVATSGDTGSAIANAFYGLDRIKVVVLFPEKEVTLRQRKQMTTLGDNIQVIAVEGKFDDCQALVKRAFADPELAELHLSSANSINIGRLLPQAIYYFYAYGQLKTKGVDDAVVFSVPSGNFGNLMGGLIAYRMGLLVKRLVVATNENDEFPNFVSSGVYQKVVPSKNCISSAMNVGHPSNLARLVALYGGIMDETGEIKVQPDLERIRKELFAVSISDAETERTIYEAFTRHELLLEPHGAVGWAGLQRYLEDAGEDVTTDQLCVSLETAHPAKFPEKIREILGLELPLPACLEGLEQKEEFCLSLDNDYQAFKSYLKSYY